MAKKRVTALLLAGALLCVTFGFLFNSSRPAPVLRFVQSRELGDSFVVSLELSNPPPHLSAVIPLKLEQMQEKTWHEVRGGVGGFSLPSGAGGAKVSCVISKVPGRLRLVAQCQTESKGLGGFLYRLRERLVHGDTRFSLNPFDKMIILHNRGNLASDEFVLQ